MSRYLKVTGIILKRANVGEADRIVTLLTPAGKMAAVGKGLRKLNSRKAGSLELFQVTNLALVETNRLPIIAEVEIRQIFPRLRKDFQATSQAFWAAELIDRFVSDGAGGPLFDHLLAYLTRVEEGASALDLRAFELLVLSEVGWHPQLYHCAHCGHDLKPGRLGWSHSLGGVIDSDCIETQGANQLITEASVKALRLLTEKDLAVSGRLTVSAAVNQEIEVILAQYLETVGERHFRSPELLREALS